MPPSRPTFDVVKFLSALSATDPFHIFVKPASVEEKDPPSNVDNTPRSVHDAFAYPDVASVICSVTTETCVSFSAVSGPTVKAIVASGTDSESNEVATGTTCITACVMFSAAVRSDPTVIAIDDSVKSVAL